MEDEFNLELGKPCPSCGELNLKECSKCKKIICLNCSPYFKKFNSENYLCEPCYIEQRKKSIRVI
ncbi:MAG: hypothetical protein HWN67_14640 [Candidatus Helarchaeota archaeon]|nr:hypothetical protein [Candidatus Helarchaeota archaeon]